MSATVVEEKELATYITLDGDVRVEMLNCSINEDFFSTAERERLNKDQIELLAKREVNADFFRTIECCLASVVKFEEEIFPSILEAIKKKYKEVFGEDIPCDSEYRDELLYASILLTKILIEAGQFSINKELFDENNQVDNGFALDFSYVNFERDLKFFSANSKLKIETREVFEVEWE